MKPVINISLKSLFVISLIIVCSTCTSTKKENNSNSTFQVQENSAVCISNIISVDDSLGKVRNHESKTLTLSNSIINYTTSLENSDFDNCPKSFKQAFENHISAWKDVLVISDKYPNIRGEMHKLFNQIKNSSDSTKFVQLEEQIWSTWREIEKQIPISN